MIAALIYVPGWGGLDDARYADGSLSGFLEKQPEDRVVETL